MQPMPRRLASVDEANLVLDRAGQVNVFLVAGTLAPGGFIGENATLNLDLLRDELRERIAALPALCQRAVRVGHRHAWEATAPDLAHHIRLSEPVDGASGLERLCARLMCESLDRARPLWELLVVPGATVGGAGVVLRVHHAVADGMTAVAMVHGLFDPDSRPNAVTPAVPVDAQLLPRATGMNALRQARVGLSRISATLWGRGVSAPMVLGVRSSRRGVALLKADIDALEASVRPRSATVNDALLAAVASGYRAALRASGDPIPDVLPVSAPVALRRRGSAGNQVGVMLVPLPLGEPDPEKRLRLIATHTRDEKVRARSQGTFEFMRGPLGARVMDRVARRQRLIGGFVTNVPGPRDELRLAGARVTSLWPVAVLAGNVRIGVAALSYGRELLCSVHFDAEHVPGATFARATADELARIAG